MRLLLYMVLWWFAVRLYVLYPTTERERGAKDDAIAQGSRVKEPFSRVGSGGFPDCVSPLGGFLFFQQTRLDPAARSEQRRFNAQRKYTE